MRATFTKSPAFLAGGGEMGALIRAKDWSKTPLGPPETWPQSLRTCVRIVLTSSQPMFVWWGRDLINIYNDPYRAIVGGKHPQALGQPASVVWREIWDEVGPRAETAIRTNVGTYDEALLLIMERNGYPEETYYTFSYSPVPGDDGGPGGILCANTDDTGRIVGERQLQTLKELGKNAPSSQTLDEVYEKTVQTLAENRRDFPFLALFQVEKDDTLRLVGQAPGTGPGDLGGFTTAIAATISDQLAAEFTEIEILDGLGARFGPLPTGAWAEPPNRALLVPIAQSGQRTPFAVLVAGCNPYRLLDANYLSFFRLVADQIATSIANVRAYEEERRRNEALRELDEAKTLFFSNVSHEFRTPLTLMLGPLEEALKANGHLPVLVHENLQTAHRNALRLQKLVNSLLDFSRIEAGRLRASYAPTDLSALTADLASNFRSVIERAGMRLVVDCPPLPEPAFVDREMWEKIVLNLLSNAFKYTLDGEIAVRLAAENGQAVLRVQDTGVGIPPDELSRLFERFHRVAGSRGRSFEGTGIGLSLIKELVGLHSGTIEAESEPGLGSTFTVRIPLGKAHLPADHLTDSPAHGGETARNASFVSEAEQLVPASMPKEAEPAVSGKKAHIVLADDNADMRAYVQRLLEPHYRVSVAPDGQAALWLVTEHRPDLVLSDVMMPVMDGFELLKTLKADPATARIPVVLLSARAGEEATIEGYESGADDYLVKPFSANELLARVRAQLHMARLRRETEKRLQSTFQQAPVAISIVGREPDFVYQMANDAFADLVDRPLSAVLGKPLLTVFPELEGQGFDDLLRQVAATGVPHVQREAPVTLVRQGQTRSLFFDYMYYPVREPEGAITGVMGVVIDVTSQVLARRKIEESERLLQTLFLHAPVGIAMLRGPEHTFELANEFYVGLVGRQRADQLVGKPLLEALPEIAGQGFFELLTQVVQTGEPIVFTDQPVDLVRSGVLETGYFNFTYQPLPAPDSGVFVIAVEVTESVLARQRIEESNRQFQQLADSMPQMVWSAHPDGYHDFYNQRWYEFTGLTYEQTKAGGWSNVLHPDDHDRAWAVWRHSLATGETYEIEYRMRRHDGAYVWQLGRALPIHDEVGGIVRWYGTCTDIDDHKRAEESLRRSEERFRGVLDGMGEGFGLLAPDFTILEYNREALRLDGRPREEIVGRSHWEVFPGTDTSALGHLLKRAMAEGVPVSLEHRYAWEEGLALWLEMRAYPTTDGLLAVFWRDVTERREAQDALRESEEKFRALADNISQLAWMTDADGWIFWYNQRWFEYTGTTLEEMQGWGWQAVHAPEEVERVTARFKHHIATGEVWEDTFPLRSKDGEYRWFLSRAVPIRDAAGKILRWFGTNTDVTESKRAEEALRESESRFRLLAETIPAAVYLTDPEGRNTFFNRWWFDYCGVPHDLATAADIAAQFIHPDDVSRVMAAFGEALRTGRTFEVEQRNRRHDGEYRWFLNRANPYRDPQTGQITQWFGTGVDIDDQKRAEVALRESDRWFRQLADSMPQIVWTARPDGFLDYYNRRWYEFIDNDLGFGDSGWLPILHPDDRQPCLDHWHRCLLTGEPYQFEFRLDDVRRPGNYRWFLARATAVRNEQNDILKWFGTCTDIHAQKTEAERLEKLVRERTGELQTSNAELERSNFDLMQFASVASHDLKEPLRKIQAFGNILSKRLDGKLDAKDRDYFTRIIGASNRMQILVEDVLSLSKLSNKDAAFVPVDLNATVARITDDLEITIREKGATVRAGNLPHLEAVPGQMHQLFQNLISNALKFTNDHPPEVTVEPVPFTPKLRAELALPAHGEYVAVEVRDNGIGFEPQYRERIFGMFQRLHGRAEYVGTGIGLTICRKIVENHHGVITAEGHPGEGATFRVVLPVRQEVESEK